MYLYLQKDGVSMGSPLGPTFANFYMGYLEQQIFSNPVNIPHIYARYIDDIFLQIKDETELCNLKTRFENNSVLKFTYELHTNNKLPFLDVLVDSSNNQFITKVYRKPTDMGTCINANSFCPERYKTSVIHNYLNRAYKISTNWNDFNTEVNQIKQNLINNNFSNFLFDQTLNRFLQQKYDNDNVNHDNKNSIKIFYHNQMQTNYKLEERVIKDLLQRNIQCISPNDKLNIICYYKNKRTCNLVMRNNLAPKPPPLQQTGTVYKFECPLQHNIPQTYIGHSQTTLFRRLSSHLNKGSIRSHFFSQHNIIPTIELLTNNTSIIATANDKIRLCIKEALMILQHSPSINIQYDNFTNILKLQPNRRINNNNSNDDNGNNNENNINHQNNNITINNNNRNLDNAGSIITTSPIRSPALNTPMDLTNETSSRNDNLEDNIEQLSNSSDLSDNLNSSFNITHNSHNISPMINLRINNLIHSVRGQNVTSPTHTQVGMRMTLRPRQRSTH